MKAFKVNGHSTKALRTQDGLSYTLEKPKVLLFVDSFVVGGTSSSIISLLRTIEASKFDITFSYFVADQSLISMLPRFIRLLPKKRAGKIRKLFRWFRKGLVFKMAICLVTGRRQSSFMSIVQEGMQQLAKQSEKNDERYDIAIAGMELLSTYYVAFCTSAERKVAWIHTNYVGANLNPQHDNSVYSMYDAVVNVSEGCRASFEASFPSFSGKSIVVPNIIDDSSIRRLADVAVSDMIRENDELIILTVARIDNKSKRFDRIVKACKYMRDHNTSFKWFVVGDGKDRPKVEQAIEENDLQESLLLLGQKSNPYPYMKGADIFVLLSAYEGKPISITETQLLGCPAIVTDFASAKEQVPEMYGKVIQNNEETIVNELFDALSDRCKILEWRHNLRNYTIDNTKSINAFECLLGDLLENGRR